jgi:streptogramin lyase
MRLGWLVFSLALCAAGGCTTLLGDFQLGSGSLGDAGIGSGVVDGSSDADASDAASTADSLAEPDSQRSVIGDGEAGPACGSTQQQCAGVCVDQSDPGHCGSCAHDCTALAHVATAATCTAGTCTFTAASCASGYAHCSMNPDDGCEVNIAQPANCGACGNACPAASPLCASTRALATSFDSGVAISASGYGCVPNCVAPTPTLCTQQCVDLTSDPNNCNACGTQCPAVQNAQVTCTAGNCGYACGSGFHDCGNGQCASDTSPASCGTSCQPCAAPAANGSATCAGTPLACGISCSQGYNLCPGNQCVNFQSDPNNCNGCGTTCAGAGNALGVGTCANALCGIQCNGALSLCPDNSCYDLQGDDHNCGACGHECFGGAGSCVGGACQPFVLAKGLTSPFGIAADGNRVYFDDSGTGGVYSVDPVSKKVVALADTAGSEPWTLTTDGTNVYWVTQGTGPLGGVWQVPADASSGAVELVYGSGLWGITVDQANIYYSTALVQPATPVYPLATGAASGQLYSIPIGGGNSAAIWPAPGNPNDGGITSIFYNPNDGYIYFVNYQPTPADPNNAWVRRVKGDGTSEKDMYPGGLSSMGLTASAAAIFVSQYTGTSLYMPIAAGGAGVIRNDFGGGPWGWALDAEFAYWVDSLASTVSKLPADVSAGPSTVASNVGKDIRQIAADARGLYWTSFADGTVWMLAK